MVAEPGRVIVAMSGGVDSSVAAGLLVRQGFDVHGLTLSFTPCLDDSTASWCCGADAADLAGAVADALDISHEVVKCDAEFEAQVLWPAWREYARGRTPSPCIACNRDVKFAMLLRLARERGATRIATGHYARTLLDPERGPMLLRGQDRRKDQSYFLFALTAEQLARVVFPLGELEKPAVRDLAREMGLASAERPESQDACFSAPQGFAEALRLRFADDARPGPIVDADGNAVGEHRGIHNYTVGQRKGLGVALGRPAYVVDIDARENRVTISTREEHLESRGLRAEALVWTGGVEPELPLRCSSQIRYRHDAAAAVVEPVDGGGASVRFDEPQRAITPGQAVVFFDRDRVLGGGWIERAVEAPELSR